MSDEQRETNDLNARDLYYIRESVTEMKQMLSKLVDKQQAIEKDLDVIKLQHDSHIAGESQNTEEIKELWTAFREYKDWSKETFMQKGTISKGRNEAKEWLTLAVLILTVIGGLAGFMLTQSKNNDRMERIISQYDRAQLSMMMRPTNR